MYNQDYAWMVLVMVLVMLISGCAPSPAHEVWNQGWCSPMHGTPSTDL
jgi:hypothetical protein